MHKTFVVTFGVKQICLEYNVKSGFKVTIHNFGKIPEIPWHLRAVLGGKHWW